jgi:hypothetical protein
MSTSRPLWTGVVLCALAPPTYPRALNQPPCFGADQPPPPLSFARRPRHNRPPWAGPFFLRRDKSSLPIASVYCHSEPPARLRRRLWCWCWCWCRGCRGLLLQPPPCLLDRDDVGRPEPPVAAMPRDTQAHTLLLREHQLPPEGIRVSDTTSICTQDHSSITHFLDSRSLRESLLESLFKKWTGWCLEAQVPGA